jgi:hypothetical protein
MWDFIIPKLPKQGDWNIQFYGVSRNGNKKRVMHAGPFYGWLRSECTHLDWEGWVREGDAWQY